MIKVYVAGPYNSDTTIETLRNIKKGIQTAARLLSYYKVAVFCPWLDFEFVFQESLDGEIPVDLLQKNSMEWLKVSDAIFLVWGWEESEGTKEEIKIARSLGIPVFEREEELVDWILEQEKT